MGDLRRGLNSFNSDTDLIKQLVFRGQNEGAKLRRRGEICFSKAAWRLTEVDGQLGIADINISNFLFTRSSMSDDRWRFINFNIYDSIFFSFSFYVNFKHSVQKQCSKTEAEIND